MPPVFCNVPTRLAVGPVPAFWTQKLNVTVSPGSITMFAGFVQFSALRVAPALIIDACGVETLCELEVANASPPVKRRRCGIIFLRVPKRTVIYRIDTHLTVVSPPIASSSLATCSVEEMSLALGESIYWIAREPPGVSNLGINCGIRCAETYSQIALAIHRSTTHPAPGSVRLI